jgi:predicted O-methyltransferase YrrM
MLGQFVKQTVGRLRRSGITVDWIREGRDSWMIRHLKAGTMRIREDHRVVQIEQLSVRNDRLGPQEVWPPYLQLKDYYDQSDRRTPRQVRCSRQMGNFFSYLVHVRRPDIVVEFGGAFGVSGMYWLSALEDNSRGRLLSFEPNEGWAGIAEKNLAAIGSRFTLVRGTFEENIDIVLNEGERIDIALIDAIHTDEFVLPQFEMVAKRLVSDGLILIDDVHFRGMNGCFEKIALDPRIRSSAVLCDHVGMVELG